MKNLNCRFARWKKKRGMLEYRRLGIDKEQETADDSTDYIPRIAVLVVERET